MVGLLTSLNSRGLFDLFIYFYEIMSWIRQNVIHRCHNKSSIFKRSFNCEAAKPSFIENAWMEEKSFHLFVWYFFALENPDHDLTLATSCDISFTWKWYHWQIFRLSLLAPLLPVFLHLSVCPMSYIELHSTVKVSVLFKSS